MERLSGVSEGTTNGKGEIIYKDTRKYAYEKTYCDGHAAPSWANMPEDQEDGDSGDEDGKRAMPMRRPQNRPGIITGLRQSSGWNW